MTKIEMHAFDRGFDACQMGATETANPYLLGSDEHLSWNDGFATAEAAEAADAGDEF